MLKAHIETQKALDLAGLCLQFGQVRRVTMHPDGELESDSTHTVMLGILAVGLIGQVTDQDLDLGLVAQFALVHDLAEAYAGDTPTARRLSPEEQAAKERAEREALVHVRKDLAGYPWLLHLIDAYESQKIPEARWVRYVDKLTPKLTHTLNRGRALENLEPPMSLDDVRASHADQGAELRKMYPEFPGLTHLFDTLCNVSEHAIDPAFGGMAAERRS